VASFNESDASYCCTRVERVEGAIARVESAGSGVLFAGAPTCASP
jgi:hypothetical protein